MTNIAPASDTKKIDRRGLISLGGVALGGLAAVGLAGPAQAAPATSRVPLEKARRAAARVALSISHPMNTDGTRSFRLTRLGDRLDIDATTPASRKHRAVAMRIANLVGNAYPPKDEKFWYAHCSRWVGPIINTTLDPRFPADWTKMQLAYLRDVNSGWVRMGTGLLSDEEMLPGDVVITDEWSPSGHVVMWVGDHGGYTNVVTEASYGGITNGVLHPDSKVGGLRRARGPVVLIDGSGRDKNGRIYSTWRYYGPQVSRRVSNGYSLQEAIRLAFGNWYALKR